VDFELRGVYSKVHERLLTIKKTKTLSSEIKPNALESFLSDFLYLMLSVDYLKIKRTHRNDSIRSKRYI
jgi:hypothetical protein